jgi:hypothetical protein
VGTGYTDFGNIIFSKKFIRKEMMIMEDMILLVIRALAIFGENGIHNLLDLANNKVIASTNKIDNELFKLVLDAVKSYVPKNVQ